MAWKWVGFVRWVGDTVVFLLFAATSDVPMADNFQITQKMAKLLTHWRDIHGVYIYIYIHTRIHMAHLYVWGLQRRRGRRLEVKEDEPHSTAERDCDRSLVLRGSRDTHSVRSTSSRSKTASWKWCSPNVGLLGSRVWTKKTQAQRWLGASTPSTHMADGCAQRSLG